MSNFLEDYKIYTQGNESPTIFHLWSALSTLSNYIGRRVWVPWGIIGNVYPQLYVILAGDPGCKKSTAMRISRGFVRALGNIQIAPASITKEAMTQLMGQKDSQCRQVYTLNDKPSEYRHLAIYADEFVNLINSGGNPIGMIDFFTEVWGSDVFQETTKNKGNQIIENPYITMLACMTTATVRELMGQKIISGGMTRRCVFVYGKNEGKSIPFPTETEEQKAACIRLEAHGKRLQKIAGEFIWTKSGKEKFETWYHTNTRRRETEPDMILRQFLETKPEYVIKLAMLVRLTEYDDLQLVITDQDVDQAVNMISMVESGSSEILRGTGRNPLAHVTKTILEKLKISDVPIIDKQLWKEVRGDASWSEFSDLVASLVGSDEVTAYMATIKLTSGQEVTVKYLTDKEASKEKISRLASTFNQATKLPSTEANQQTKLTDQFPPVDLPS